MSSYHFYTNGINFYVLWEVHNNFIKTKPSYRINIKLYV